MTGKTKFYIFRGIMNGGMICLISSMIIYMTLGMIFLGNIKVIVDMAIAGLVFGIISIIGYEKACKYEKYIEED